MDGIRTSFCFSIFTDIHSFILSFSFVKKISTNSKFHKTKNSNIKFTAKGIFARSNVKTNKYYKITNKSSNNFLKRLVKTSKIFICIYEGNLLGDFFFNFRLAQILCTSKKMTEFIKSIRPKLSWKKGNLIFHRKIKFEEIKIVFSVKYSIMSNRIFLSIKKN